MGLTGGPDWLAGQVGQICVLGRWFGQVGRTGGDRLKIELVGWTGGPDFTDGPDWVQVDFTGGLDESYGLD